MARDVQGNIRSNFQDNFQDNLQGATKRSIHGAIDATVSNAASNNAAKDGEGKAAGSATDPSTPAPAADRCADCTISWDPDAPGALASAKRLKAAEVKWLLWEGMPLLDARTVAEYGRCQIAGAMQVGVRPTRHQLQRLGLNPKDPLVCYSNAEQRARQLSAHLSALGYRCVYLLEAGLDGFLPRQHA